MGDVPRRVHSAEESLFDILWELRSRTKLLTIDPWREIGIRWIDRAEDSGVTLDKTKRAAFALISESSRYATRVLVVAPGRRVDTAVLPVGASSIPLKDRPMEIESITVNGIAQVVEDWEVDADSAVLTPPNEMPVLPTGIAEVAYIGATGSVRDGRRRRRRTCTPLTRWRPTRRMRRWPARSAVPTWPSRSSGSRYQAITIPSRVEHLFEGQRVTVEATKYGLDQTMIVRRLTEALRSSSARYHGVAYTAEMSPLAIPLLRLGTGEINGSVVG